MMHQTLDVLNKTRLGFYLSRSLGLVICTFLILSGAVTGQSLYLSRSSIDFTAEPNGSLPVSQNFVLANTASGTINWSLSYDSTWLTVSPTSGNDSYRYITVSVNTTDLPIAIYNDIITIESPDAYNSPQTISIQYEVTDKTGFLYLSQTAFDFTASPNGTLPVTQSFVLGNTVSGAINWSLSYDSTWLSVSPTSGNNSYRRIYVYVNTTVLPIDIYNDIITVESPDATNSPRTITVQYEVAEPTSNLQLSKTAFAFTAEQDGSLPVTQSFVLANTISETLNWSLSYDSTWLTVSPTSGLDDYRQITVSVNTTNMPAAVYHDIITVESPDATNSPRTITVQYVVTEPPINLIISETALEFTTEQNGPLPATQSFVLASTVSETINWWLHYDSSWLAASPTSGIDSDLEITVQINSSNHPVGIFNEVISIISPDAANSPQAITVQYEITQIPSCCGEFTAGLTGNTDCSDDGKRNLADITCLIDRVYISKADLCCEENGNVEGDIEGRINLADITILIDYVYISRVETVSCD